MTITWRGKWSRRSSAVLSTVCILFSGALAAGCGTGETGESGANTVNWYVFNEPGGAFEDAIKRCNEQAGGDYKIDYVRLPTDADQQRELVARRLAAEDSDIDIVGMDVIWTAEFAEAGWIKQWKGADAQRAREGVLEGPLRTAEYQDGLWAAPFTSNTQLLFYDKSKVKTPPETWDEMIDQAAKLKKGIEVQAARYEGYTVWVNSLVNSAGGSLVDEEGTVKIGPETRKAAEIIRRVADEAAPAGMSNNKEDQARLGFESGRSAFEVNYTFVYPSAKEKGGEFFENFGVARYPGVERGKPSKVTLGGINLGIGAYSKHPDLAFRAAQCLKQPANQVVAAEKGGLAPSDEALYDNPKIKKAFPFSRLLRDTLDDGVPRPVTPAYSDVSQAIQRTFHPPEKLQPDTVIEKLQDRLDKAAEGKIF